MEMQIHLNTDSVFQGPSMVTTLTLSYLWLFRPQNTWIQLSCFGSMSSTHLCPLHMIPARHEEIWKLETCCIRRRRSCLLGADLDHYIFFSSSQSFVLLGHCMWIKEPPPPLIEKNWVNLLTSPFPVSINWNPQKPWAKIPIIFSVIFFSHFIKMMRKLTNTDMEIF